MSQMTKRSLLVGARVALAVLAFIVPGSAIGAAQSTPAGTPAAVAGTYEGWIRGSSQGDAAMTVTLAQDGATFTGTMTAGPYSFTISEGKVEGEALSWAFSSGDITGTVTATCKSGAIDGSWSAMGSESGSIELKKSPEN
jgi:hypothetical protein